MNSRLVEFQVDGLPPTLNHYYGRSGQRVYKRADAREWQEETAGQMSDQWGNRAAMNFPLELYIEFETRDHRKWDLDNRIKPLQDCLELAGIIENDRQIELLQVKRTYGRRDITRVELRRHGS